MLLVEDNPEDVFFMKRACRLAEVPLEMDVVSDGREAVDYLGAEGIYAAKEYHPIPDLVFLDIKLPKLTGLEVLEWIRTRPELNNLPVIMLTSSSQAEDIERAYKLNVTSYLRKTANQEEFTQGVRVILKYWLQLNITPDRTDRRGGV